MPIYNVVMGQGVSVNNLARNALSTGLAGGMIGDDFDLDDDKQRLSSCSAVILGNSNTGAAGLYHFPAGSINSDQGSQDLLKAMAAAIRPNDAYIVAGNSEAAQMDLGYNVSFMVEGKLQQIEQLNCFVRGLLSKVGGRLQESKATKGIAWVTWASSWYEFEVCDKDALKKADQTFVDLRNKPRGAQAAYHVYRRT